MNRTIPAIFDAGVFRPLTPVDLAQGTPVEVQVSKLASVEPAANSFRQKLENGEPAKGGWLEYVERMEALPDDSPNDGLSNRDHDRIIYGG